MSARSTQRIFTALCLSLAGVLAAAPAAAEQPLRIVAFNVQCLQAPNTNDSRLARYRWGIARRDHAERVASVIETLLPDILCLVEVTSKASVDLLVEILHEKGLTDYRGYHIENYDKFSGFDVAFLSRISPDTVEGQTIRCMYSDADDPAWRAKYAYQDDDGKRRERSTGLSRHAVFYATAGGVKLGLLGLHLKADPGDNYSNARRMAETEIAGRIIRQEIVERGYLPVVLGDLNDYDPDLPDRDANRSTQTRVLRGMKDFDAKSAGDELFNAAEKVVRLADRYTSHWDVNENGTADIGDVYTMIDYVLLPRSLATYHTRTFIARGSDLKTSDHWPVVVDLVLPDNKARD